MRLDGKFFGNSRREVNHDRPDSPHFVYLLSGIKDVRRFVSGKHTSRIPMDTTSPFPEKVGSERARRGVEATHLPHLGQLFLLRDIDVRLGDTNGTRLL